MFSSDSQSQASKRAPLYGHVLAFCNLKKKWSSVKNKLVNDISRDQCIEVSSVTCVNQNVNKHKCSLLESYKGRIITDVIHL